MSTADELAEAQRAAAVAVASTGAVVQAGMFSRDVIATFTTPEFAEQLAWATTSQVNEFLLCHPFLVGQHDASNSCMQVTRRLC